MFTTFRCIEYEFRHQNEIISVVMGSVSSWSMVAMLMADIRVVELRSRNASSGEPVWNIDSAWEEGICVR